MMSSDGEMDSVSKCIASGAKDYLIKPIRITVKFKLLILK